MAIQKTSVLKDTRFFVVDIALTSCGLPHSFVAIFSYADPI